MSKHSELCDWIIEANRLSESRGDSPSVKVARVSKILEEYMREIRTFSLLGDPAKTIATKALAEVEKILE